MNLLFLRLDIYGILGLWGLALGLFIICYFLLRKKNKVLFFALLLGYLFLNRLHYHYYKEPPTDFDMGTNVEYMLKINLEAILIFIFVVIFWLVQRIRTRKKKEKELLDE
jgi:hypothetical protein